jgi:transcriptional regulator with XRE-family HTH domain
MKSREITKNQPTNVSITLGYWARSLRTHLELSQKEIAKLARVPLKSVDLLENNEPLPLDEKRKILKELYAIKINKFS